MLSSTTCLFHFPPPSPSTSSSTNFFAAFFFFFLILRPSYACVPFPSLFRVPSRTSSSFLWSTMSSCPTTLPRCWPSRRKYRMVTSSPWRRGNPSGSSTWQRWLWLSEKRLPWLGTSVHRCDVYSGVVRFFSIIFISRSLGLIRGLLISVWRCGLCSRDSGAKVSPPFLFIFRTKGGM